MNRELINIKETHEKVEFESILNVHGKNEEGQTPLHMAATRGHIELVASLIERGADLNPKSNFGYTPLHYAANQSGVEIAKLLIDNGADVNAKSDFEYTPFIMQHVMARQRLLNFLLRRELLSAGRICLVSLPFIMLRHMEE